MYARTTNLGSSVFGLDVRHWLRFVRDHAVTIGAIMPLA